MSKKRDTVAQRLVRLVEEERSRSFGTRLAGAGMLAGLFLEGRDAVERAFKSFGLDPTRLSDREQLLHYLARSHFQTKKGGAPRKWSRDRQRQLLIDFRTIAKGTLKFNLTAVTGQMKDDPRLEGRYQSMTPGAIKKQLHNTIKLLNELRRHSPPIAEN